MYDKTGRLDELRTFRNEIEAYYMKEDAETREMLKAEAEKDSCVAEVLAKTISFGRLTELGQTVMEKSNELIVRLIMEQKDIA